MKHTITVLLVVLAGIISCRNGQIPPGFTQDTSLSAEGFTHTRQVETRQITRPMKQWAPYGL